MIEERCWFSQIDFFVENNILFLSSQFLGVIINKFAGANDGSDCSDNTGLSLLV